MGLWSKTKKMLYKLIRRNAIIPEVKEGDSIDYKDGFFFIYKGNKLVRSVHSDSVSEIELFEKRTL